MSGDKGGGGGNAQSGSSSGPDPSSSDFSADTVIYVGPCPDDATDNEHPPVFLPNLNSGDNRCAMNKVLKGSAVEKSIVCKSPIKKANLQKRKKIEKSLNVTLNIDYVLSPREQQPKVPPTKKPIVSREINQKPQMKSPPTTQSTLK